MPGDSFFANQTGRFDPNGCYSYSAMEVNENAAWLETKAGLVASGNCLAGYFISSITRACLTQNSIGVWDTPSSSCLSVYCAAEVLNGVTFPFWQVGQLVCKSCPPNSKLPSMSAGTFATRHSMNIQIILGA